MNIGSRIRSIREDLDLTQEQIASMIPMNQSNYSKIERSIQEPNLYQLKRIAEILDLDLNELLEIHSHNNSYEKDLVFARKVKRIFNDTYKNK